jgi:hypothetical protein
LEIGVGNKTVSNYLKNQGIEVTTVDIDPSLEPDRVGSVTNLRKFFEEGSFDTLLCAEVLEHLPFDCFEVALKEMKYVAKNFVVLSLPYFGIEFMFRFKVPLVKEKKLLFKIPFYREHRFDGEHYWEIGKKGYSIKFILKILSKLFVINRYYYIADNPYHMIFALDVKDKEIN